MKTILSLINRYKYWITIVVFAILIGFVGENSIVNRLAQKQEINELNDAISAEQQEYENDKVKLERIHNNPEAVKRVAREKYYMKTENEDVFVIGDGK